mgnify:CR=1 FL=1
MSKTKSAFFCQNCGAQTPKWTGQCSTCNEWNTIVEEVIQKEEKRDIIGLLKSILKSEKYELVSKMKYTERDGEKKNMDGRASPSLSYF